MSDKATSYHNNMDGDHDLIGVGTWDHGEKKVYLVRKDSSPPGRVEEVTVSELTKAQVSYYYEKYWCTIAGAYMPIDKAFLEQFRD